MRTRIPKGEVTLQEQRERFSERVQTHLVSQDCSPGLEGSYGAPWRPGPVVLG